MTEIILPAPPARVHFIGIGGIGMSGLAAVLHEQGYVVTGSDSGSNAQTEQLAASGVAIQLGHSDKANAASADLVVITAAVSDNPEIAAATERGIPIIKRARLLGLLSEQKISIAVAGSHGKSTTSGMLVTALTELGVAPSYFVGAVVGSNGSNSAWNDGDFIVVEADEYDRSFLTLSPEIAIITNIEFDHPDIYTQESYDEAFRKFVERIKPWGVLVAYEDDPGVQRLLAWLEDNFLPVHVVTYGERSVHWKVLQFNGEWRAERIDGLCLPISPGVPGRHNVLNAVAAVIAISELHLETEEEPFATVDASIAIQSFTGVGRRFDLAGEAAGITVIDDYAHHPTEIAATLQAARERFPDRRIWAIFQPHTYSRTKALIDDFAAALAVADEIVLLDIYAARESDDGTISSADLARRIGPRAHLAPGVPDVVPAVYPLLQEGDVVLTIGAGDVTHAAPALVRALERGSID